MTTATWFASPWATPATSTRSTRQSTTQALTRSPMCRPARTRWPWQITPMWIAPEHRVGRGHGTVAPSHCTRTVVETHPPISVGFLTAPGTNKARRQSHKEILTNGLTKLKAHLVGAAGGVNRHHAACCAAFVVLANNPSVAMAQCRRPLTLGVTDDERSDYHPGWWNVRRPHWYPAPTPEPAPTSTRAARRSRQCTVMMSISRPTDNQATLRVAGRREAHD